MRFVLAEDISEGVDDSFIFNLSQTLETLFENKSYGEDIKELAIGIICVHPQFDEFAKPRRARYISDKKAYGKDGIQFEFEKLLQYEIKLDYNQIKSLDINASKKILAQEILASVSVIKRVKKIKDFDFDSFYTDLEKHFNEMGLL